MTALNIREINSFDIASNTEKVYNLIHAFLTEPAQ